MFDDERSCPPNENYVPRELYAAVARERDDLRRQVQFYKDAEAKGRLLLIPEEQGRYVVKPDGSVFKILEVPAV